MKKSDYVQKCLCCGEMQPYYAIYCGECGALLRPVPDQPDNVEESAVTPTTLMPEPTTIDGVSVTEKMRAASKKTSQSD